MAPPPYDLPLNGLLVERDGREGCVIETTISGKPTPQAPHVTSQYMVMWDDGKKEGGLSRAAVQEMSTRRWSSPAWQDLEFEASLPGGFQLAPSGANTAGGNGAGFGLPVLYAPQVGAGLQPGVTACIAPPPASAPPGAAKRPGFGYAMGQDKSRISALFKSTPRPEVPNVLSQGSKGKTPSSARKPPVPAAPKAKASGGGKAAAGRKGKRKARADSESAGEEEEEEPLVEEEPVAAAAEEEEEEDPFARQYPREMCFTPGDTPLAEYKDKDPGDADFEVEHIVDEVVIDRKKYVLVKWKGYELDQEDWSNLSDVKHLDIYKDWVKERKAAAKKK